ncbi:ABC transporter ATP-binding protein [Aquisalimonas sp. APHAB1-3]|uniref:ABC transporter ATP-binding protein n=1 Tax=Aquisalimonas sp. APHAB1-3 TaxID=3402080 RepID=UPI003AAD3FC4
MMHKTAEEQTEHGQLPAVEADNLTIHFRMRGGDTVKAADDVCFRIRPGETFGIIGESGSGKSTVGRALVGLLNPTSGAIRYQGQDVASMSRKAFRDIRRNYQIIFQDPHAALNPRMTILQSLQEPLTIAGQGTTDERRRIAYEALERSGLPAVIGSRYPHELSGGQKQRVNIARALTVRPQFIVCDEVVAALDVSVRGSILNLFAELQEEYGLTYAFITHDISVVAHISHRVSVMYLGRMVEMGPTGPVTEKPLHPYTHALLSAEPQPLPSELRQDRERVRLSGEIPSPIAPPSGCRFRTRCPAAQTLCGEKTPEMKELLPDHWVACHFATPDGPPDGS